MMNRTAVFRGALLGAALAGMSVVAWGQTLNVTSPQSNDFLGKTNTLRFTAASVTRQVKIVAVTTKVSDPSATFRSEGLFSPTAEDKIDGSLQYNFAESLGTGLFNVRVDMFYANDLATAIRTVNITNVSIDTKAPKLRNVVPTTGGFVSSLIPIRATIDEPNVNRWQVRVNSADFANNSGSNNQVSLTYDARTVENDGPQTISLDVTDRGQNSVNRTINVTLDRVKPNATVSSPTSIVYRPNATIPVLINIADQFQGSVQSTGVNVYLRTMDGQFIQKVARSSARPNGTGLQWVGRIVRTNKIPKRFKLRVESVDRAGNVASVQEVTVNYGA